MASYPANHGITARTILARSVRCFGYLAGKFIGMYVNEFTRDYGEIGRAAIRKFLGEARDKGYIDAPVEAEFV